MLRKERITELLQETLAPTHLSVENESFRHHVPEGSETHFKIIAVSSQFLDLKPIARHRLLNQLLADELNSGLHALSMHLYTPDEWKKNKNVLSSPNCHDGYKHQKE